MKTLTILLIVLLVVVGLLGFGLQKFLTEGLTAALNDTILPIVKSEYGLDVSVENASVNLLKGRAELGGLAVQNLKGYEKSTLLTVDSCLLKVEMMSLLKRDPIVIRLAEATGVELNIERNKKGKINVQELAKTFEPEKKPQAAPVERPGKTLAEKPVTVVPEEDAPAAPKKKMEPIPIHIRRVAFDGTVLYADAQLEREVPLNLRLTASDLFSVPDENQNSSLLVLRGSLVDDQASFATDLNALVEPLTDLENPSFNASGSVLEIDAKFLKKLLRKNDMSSGNFSIKPSIVCKQGKLKGSKIDLTLNDLEIYGAKIGDTTLPLELKGPLQDPRIDLTEALRTLFSEQSIKIIEAIKQKGLTGQGSTNAPGSESLSDMLIGELNKNVKEVEESEELQKSLRKLSDSLFGR